MKHNKVGVGGDKKIWFGTRILEYRTRLMGTTRGRQRPDSGHVGCSV